MDDLFLIRTDEEKLAVLHDVLCCNFDMTDLENIKKFLSLKYNYIAEGLLIHQFCYILDILQEFNIEDFKLFFCTFIKASI